jgi:transcriptional regulator with XRE-family HTH domain
LTDIRTGHMLRLVMPLTKLSPVPVPLGARQQDVAERVGISQGHLSRVLARKGVPSLAVAVALARELGVPVETFMPAAASAADNASTAA